MRVRIYFDKTEVMRFTGQLDVHRTFERMFRRANLPLAYSHGFHLQPRINFASALPLGFTSQAEIVDIWLETSIPLADIETALKITLPPGIQIQQIEEIDSKAPTLQTQVVASEFTITLLLPQKNLNELLSKLLGASSLPRVRRGKAYDLRPLIYKLSRLPDDDESHPRFKINLASRPGATGRPEEVLDELGIPPESTRIHRTRIIFE
jgi:radical SAM-linked protein